jgi:hypothetical protein
MAETRTYLTLSLRTMVKNPSQSQTDMYSVTANAHHTNIAPYR